MRRSMSALIVFEFYTSFFFVISLNNFQLKDWKTGLGQGEDQRKKFRLSKVPVNRIESFQTSK